MDHIKLVKLQKLIDSPTCTISMYTAASNLIRAIKYGNKEEYDRQIKRLQYMQRVSKIKRA